MAVWSGIPFYSQENCRMEILDAVICSLSRSLLFAIGNNAVNTFSGLKEKKNLFPNYC